MSSYIACIPYTGHASMPLELRLDLNESTTGCSPRVLEKIKSMDAQKLALYAPRDVGEKMVATVMGRPPAQLLLTNGGDEAIDIFCRGYLEPDTEAIIITPAFSMYEIFAQAAGAKIVTDSHGTGLHVSRGPGHRGHNTGNTRHLYY